jgi:ferritin
MKTIKQPSELTFHAIDFKEALKLVNLMDNLVRSINIKKMVNMYGQKSDEDKNKYYEPYEVNATIDADEVETIYEVLTNLGFAAKDEVWTDEEVANQLDKIYLRK